MQQKLIDPINAVITFNIAVRPDEGMPIESVSPVQITVPASRFGEPLVILLKDAIVQQLGNDALSFRLLGDAKPEDLPSPEPLELPEEEKSDAS